jgi:hypothetical protein
MEFPNNISNLVPVERGFFVVLWEGLGWQRWRKFRIMINCCVYAKIVVNLNKKNSTFLIPLNCVLMALFWD